MAEFDFSYYTLYLKDYLQECGDRIVGFDPALAGDVEFINGRGDSAAETFEQCRRQGMSVWEARESAMAVLLSGLTELEPTEEERLAEEQYQRERDEYEKFLRESGYYGDDEEEDDDE